MNLLADLPTELLNELPLDLYNKGVLAATCSELKNILYIHPIKGYKHYSEWTVEDILKFKHYDLLKLMIKEKNPKISDNLHKIINHIYTYSQIELLDYINGYYDLSSTLTTLYIFSVDLGKLEIIKWIHKYYPAFYSQNHINLPIINNQIHILKYLVNEIKLTLPNNPYYIVMDRNIDFAFLDFFKETKPDTFIDNINNILESGLSFNFYNLDNIDWLYENYPDNYIIREKIENNYHYYLNHPNQSYLYNLINKYRINQTLREEIFLGMIVDTLNETSFYDRLKIVYDPNFRPLVITMAFQGCDSYYTFMELKKLIKNEFPIIVEYYDSKWDNHINERNQNLLFEFNSL